jgi:hypothetical protein
VAARDVDAALLSRGDCRCAYGNEQTGTFEIEATLDGSVEIQTVDVEMEESGCHVATQEVCFFGECTE